MTHSFIISTSAQKLAALRGFKGPERASSLSNTALVYKDLMGTSLESTLINAYPMTHKLLDQSSWQKIVLEFFTTYQQHSPYFWQMPKGFYEFVRKAEWSERLKILYLADLMEFEWLGIEISMMPDLKKLDFCSQGDLMQVSLYVNPEHQLKKFVYPVFQYSTDSSKTTKGEYHVFCFRHPKTLQVHGICLSPFYRRVMECLIRRECTGKLAISQAAEYCTIPIDPRLLEEGRAFFQELLSQEGILGFQ